MCVLGMSAELQPKKIAVNALWPQTVIDTASTRAIFKGQATPKCRKPDIMADAAHGILCLQSDKPENTGNFFVDEEFLSKHKGITDFDGYRCQPGIVKHTGVNLAILLLRHGTSLSHFRIGETPH